MPARPSPPGGFWSPILPGRSTPPGGAAGPPRIQLGRGGRGSPWAQLRLLLSPLLSPQTPFSLTLKLWDAYILDGERVLTAMAYTVLKVHSSE